MKISFKITSVLLFLSLISKIHLNEDVKEDLNSTIDSIETSENVDL